jgi:hypothetical protein
MDGAHESLLGGLSSLYVFKYTSYYKFFNFLSSLLILNKLK